MNEGQPQFSNYALAAAMRFQYAAVPMVEQSASTGNKQLIREAYSKYSTGQLLFYRDSTPLGQPCAGNAVIKALVVASTARIIYLLFMQVPVVQPMGALQWA